LADAFIPKSFSRFMAGVLLGAAAGAGAGAGCAALASGAGVVAGAEAAGGAVVSGAWLDVDGVAALFPAPLGLAVCPMAADTRAIAMVDPMRNMTIRFMVTPSMLPHSTIGVAVVALLPT
jgi:hypothetical protein